MYKKQGKVSNLSGTESEDDEFKTLEVYKDEHSTIEDALHTKRTHPFSIFVNYRFLDSHREKIMKK